MTRHVKQLIFLAISFITMTTSLLWACGPDFPIAATQVRDATLLKTPLVSSFSISLKKHLTRTDADPLLPTDQNDDTLSRLILEYAAEGISATETLNRLKDYPLSEQLYATGAVGYRRGDPAQAQYYFKQVLDLPLDSDNKRAIWASYMLGIYYRDQYLSLMGVARDADGVAQLANFYASQSHKYFGLTRQLHQQGLPDPLNLALESYGEEARLYLHDTEFSPCIPETIDDHSCYLQIPPQSFTDALLLYLEQVARTPDTRRYEDSFSGINSVRRLLYAALHSDTLTHALLTNPKTQDSLILYATHTLIPDADYWTLSDFAYEKNPPTWTEYIQAQVANKDSSSLLIRFLKTLDKIPPSQIQQPMVLATLYYGAGLYDKAAELIQDQDSGQAYWLKAKLAVLRNDLRGATQAYAQASKQFMTEEQQNNHGKRVTLFADEQGILALSQKEYAEALVWLLAGVSNHNSDGIFRTDTFIDIAYVSERVLTTDELKLFVDQRLSLPQQLSETPEGVYVRHILARRLMREQRFSEAIPYFEPEAPRVIWLRKQGRDIESTQKQAIAYVDAYQESEKSWTAMGRAQALYQAAILARTTGLEIMGYELFPDFAIYDGNYAGVDEGQPRSHAYMTEDEQQRVQASKSPDIPRFHYRQVAAKLAVEAAHLLPTGSQAYSASLCQAYQWSKYDQPELAQTYYRDYLKHGLPLAGHFEATCPEPDYDEATIRGWKNKAQGITRIWKDTNNWIRRHF